MPRRNDIAKILVIGGAVLAAPVAKAAKPIQVRLMFCVPMSQGWSIQRFKPLIDPRANTEFAEMSMAGSQLLEFKMRHFSERAETAFDYKFAGDGRLNSIHGSITVFGSWVGEANLMPDSDGSVPEHHVTYRSNNQQVQRPDDAADYVGVLDKFPIYRTAQAVPCAAMLKEAEKMNATQE
jgi:hypothetical protein